MRADWRASGLGYTARSGADAHTGAYTTELGLDPPLDGLLRFEGLAEAEAPARRTLPAALRQVVAHECVVEHIRRGDAARAARGAAAAEAQAGDGELAPQEAPPPGTRVRSCLRGPAKLPCSPGCYARQTAATLLDKYKSAAPHKGAPKKRSGRQGNSQCCADSHLLADATAALSSHSASALQSDAFYKFHEGYTNAVRRTVRIEELL